MAEGSDHIIRSRAEKDTGVHVLDHGRREGGCVHVCMCNAIECMPISYV
jgi:hypothetical protein